MANFGNFGSPQMNNNNNNNNNNQQQDVIAQGDYMQGRGLSNICFKKTQAAVPQEIVCASSWDNRVYTFQLQTNQTGQVSQARQVSICQFPQPTLDVCFGVPQSPHDANVFAACADNSVYMVQNFSQAQKIGQFQAPVSAVRTIMINNQPMVIAASWDRTVKLFDARQPNPAASVTLSERIYCMDAKNTNGANGFAVCCTADKKCHVFQFPNFQRPVTDHPTALKMPPRCVALINDGSGICVGSIEGRIAVHYFNDPDAVQKRTFAFKCHRSKTGRSVFPVNDIKFSRYNTFVTAGSDGIYNIWDKDSKQRLKGRPAPQNTQNPMPIVSTDFNSAGTILAFAESYDWYRGAQQEQYFKNHRLVLHTLPPGQVQPKAASVNNNNNRKGSGGRGRNSNRRR
jgi:mRNA export factor